LILSLHSIIIAELRSNSIETDGSRLGAYK